jgi:hypothetical protein
MGIDGNGRLALREGSEEDFGEKGAAGRLLLDGCEETKDEYRVYW